MSHRQLLRWVGRFVGRLSSSLPGAIDHIGILKHYACSRSEGDVLLELDHDDLLTEDAVEAVIKTFRDPEVGFIYSNFAEFTGDFERVPRYSAEHGWQYRPFRYSDHILDECIAFEPSAATMSRVWYSANHLRAWCQRVYEEIGGYSSNLRVNDDQKLVSRTYLATHCLHIDRCLYLYRRHGSNTTWDALANQTIQRQAVEIYDQYIHRLAAHWADLNGLRKLNLGGRFTPIVGFESVDRADADVVADLDGPWPFVDSSVGVIVANDILEHLRDKLHTIREIYRVLAPGGYLLARTPSTDG